VSLRATLATLALLLGACGDRLIVAHEVLPPGTELKVVAWSDGVTLRATLEDAGAPTRLALSDALAEGRPVSVWIFPFSRAELDAAVPGLVGLDRAQLTAAVQVTEGSGLVIPGRGVVLEAQVDGDSADDLSYTPVPRAAWDSQVATRARPALRLVVRDAEACRALAEPEVLDLPVPLFIQAITVRDAERVIVAGATSTTALELYEVGPAGSRRITHTLDKRAGAATLGWDASTDTLWGVQRGVIFRLDAEGHTVPFTPLPGGVRSAAFARDGTAVVLGLTEADGTIPTFVYSSRTQDWATVRDLFRTTVGDVEAYGRDRYLAHINCWARAWEDDPQRGFAHWGRERATDVDCSLFPRDLALDAGLYYWLGARGDLRRGTTGEDTWATLALPIPVTSSDSWPRALAPMEDGHFAVAGDHGRVAVWIGDRWCVPPALEGFGFTLGAGTADTAWFVGTNRVSGGPPVASARVVRLTLR
jgi:hypothetical protein